MDKQTAELRALVNNGQFEEALRTFDSLQGSDLDGLRKLALDTIFDAVTKYRDNNDDNLRTLIVSLFDAIHPDLLKFRICFNFLTARSTPHLNELLTSQLRILVTPDFRENHPDEWLELKEVLPAKLAEHLSVESDDDVLYPAAHAAHIMFIFKEIPFLIPEGMSKVFAEAVNSSEPELPAAFPLLVYHSRTHPFSPKLLQVTKPVVLIPSVYRRPFLVRRLVEGLILYLQETEYNYERHFVKPIVSDLSTIVELLEDLDTADLDPCCNLLLPLLRFVEDFEQRSFRVPIMDKCQQLIQLFPSAQRCLLFKLILPKILDNNDLCLDNESTVVAWLVDLYRRNLEEEPFQKELGSFLGILKDVRYSEMLQASNYYSSVFCLVQTIAAKRLNLAMLPIVESQLIDPIYAQLKDYIQLEEMRQKDEKQKKDAAPKIPENIGFEVAMPAPEGTVVEQLQLVMFGCEQSRKFIADALSSVQ